MISQQSMISVIKPIHTDTYHHILKIIQKYELDYIIDDDWNYAAQLDAENAIFERLDPHKLASCIDVANIDTPIKIILLNIEPTQITTILDELNKYHQELEMIHHSNEYNIDITAQNINKYTALQYIFDNVAQKSKRKPLLIRNLSVNSYITIGCSKVRFKL